MESKTAALPALRLDDAEIGFTVTGNGPAMLFLSATARSGAAWKLHQVPEFSRDHRTIVYDQRGTGTSATSCADFSTARLVADAVALLDHLDVDRAIVCGHSNGGRVAQLLAIEHPERVEKLILASTGATHRTKGIPLKLCLGLVELGYARYDRKSALATGCTPAYYAAHRAEVDAFLDLLAANRPSLEVFLGHVIGRGESDTTSRLTEIVAPTLVLVGDDETHGEPTRRTSRSRRSWRGTSRTHSS